MRRESGGVEARGEAEAEAEAEAGVAAALARAAEAAAIAITLFMVVLFGVKMNRKQRISWMAGLWWICVSKAKWS